MTTITLVTGACICRGQFIALQLSRGRRLSSSFKVKVNEKDWESLINMREIMVYQDRVVTVSTETHQLDSKTLVITINDFLKFFFFLYCGYIQMIPKCFIL